MFYEKFQTISNNRIRYSEMLTTRKKLYAKKRLELDTRLVLEGKKFNKKRCI